MQKLLFLALVASVSSFTITRNEGAPADAKAMTDEQFVQYVNSAQKLWKAAVPKESYKNRLMDIKYTKHPEGVVYAEEPKETKAIPDSFDARVQWPECPSISKIRNQAQCGACWAFAASEALTDRICIASGGKQQPEISSEDLLDCCGSFCGYGCQGGYPYQAWSYAAQVGIVTGGGYYEQTGCKPYSISPTWSSASTPACSKSCTNAQYKTPYDQDKHYASSAYAVRQSVSQIQQEIMTNGPVEAAFTVYQDFYAYTGGVYRYTYGYEEGGHAVKIFGWGSLEDGTPYWIVANSWDTTWGENGFFRIIRGQNDCGIEEGITAGGARV